MDSEDMSFEANDLELEEDLESENEQDYEGEFNKNRDRFCHLIDQVLYDINCLDFFDKAQRTKVNNYLEAFGT